MESREITVRGVPMRWQESGAGFPVVLLHGIPTSPRVWRHVAPRLHGARVLAWELVGYGDSIPAGRGLDLSLSSQAQYFAGWLREMGIERAVFAGHDLGGGVAQIAAVRNPELCAGLFLANAVCYDSWPLPIVRAMRDTAPVSEHLPDALFKAVFSALLRRGHDDAARTAESIDLHWEPYARHGGAAAFARQTRDLHHRDTLAVANDLPRLRVPARVVWGGDGLMGVRYAHRLAWDLDAPLEVIPGARHFTNEDHPDVHARHINDLVQEAEAASVRQEPASRRVAG